VWLITMLPQPVGRGQRLVHLRFMFEGLAFPG
jgi:hypothetical protein